MAKLNSNISVAIFVTFIGLSSQLSLAETYLYRYINDKGVKVLNHAIPPEFAQNGYEILSESGQLIRVVEPAPSEEELSKLRVDREVKEKYAILKRRYSSVVDIDSAKKRRLSSLDTSIAILRGNIGSIKIRIENLMKEAAEMERAGKSVSSRLLQQMKDARSELTVAENSLATRQQEYEEVSIRFDNDRAAFVAGSELVAENDNNSLN